MHIAFTVPNRALAIAGLCGVCFAAGTVIATEFPSDNGEALVYSGVLTDSAGDPRQTTDTIQVKLFAAESGGNALCAGSAAAVDLRASQGRFLVPLPALCTDVVSEHGDVWAEVTVASTTLPRQKLGAVPFAVAAREAQTADFATSVAANGVATAALQSGAVTEEKLAPTLASSVSGLATAFAVDDGVATTLNLVQAEYEGVLDLASISHVPVTIIHDSHSGLDAATDRYVFPHAGTYQVSYHWFSSQVGAQCTIGARLTGGPTIPKNGWDSRAVQPLATPTIIAGTATRVVRVEAGEWMAIEGAVSCAPSTPPGDGDNATVRVSIVRLG